MTSTPCRTWSQWERFVVAISRVDELDGGLIPQSVQEILRIHPAVLDMQRVAVGDNVLPLTKPIVGVSGKVYKELPVPTGTLVFLSIAGYNLYARPLAPLPRRDPVVETGFYHFTGIKICGGQTPTSSDRNDGWTREKSLKRLSGFTATCAWYTCTFIGCAMN